MESFTSSHELADDNDNLSVKYTNLYYIDGKFTYITTENVNLPYVNKWTNTYGWKPIVKVFGSEEEIDRYIKGIHFRYVETALLNDNLWYGNIGHALWDGIYPVYLAAVKFGFDNHPFVYLADNWTNPKVIANEAIERFSGNKIESYPLLNQPILFKTLIAGTGRTGNRVMNEEYTLYGGKWNGIEKFKNRMLSSFGASVDLPINDTPNIAIISNKRYSKEELNVINEVVEIFKPVSNISFIDWYKCSSFEEQMKIVQNIDIHISGPGTGMMYMPFLKKGAVNINLGYMEHTQTNTARPNIKIQNSSAADHIFPGWMEQSVCAAVKDVSTLYYDRFTYNKIEKQPLIDIINKAISIVNQGQIVESKHNVDAQVFIEYCKRVSNARQLCDYLTGIAFFIELFVHEHPLAVPENIVDIHLLRRIKDELGMNRNYEIKKPL